MTENEGAAIWSPPSPEELAWLSALLDAEGYFVTSRRSKTRPVPRLTIGIKMADRDLIQRAANLLGTTYIQERPPPTPRHEKTQWACRVRDARASAVMRAIYPWLGERRRARVRELLGQEDV